MKFQMSGVKCQVSGEGGGRVACRVWRQAAGNLLVPRDAKRKTQNGFTLVEVMIALGIFFMAMFTILGLVANSLRNARALQRQSVGCGMVAAELSLTNKLVDVYESGDFGNMYPDYRWEREIYEKETNGIFQVDMVVLRRSGGAVDSKMSILLFRPDSPPGKLSRGRLQ